MTVPPDPQAWDIAFLAIEPVRAAEIAFSAPYVVIQGTYIVRNESPLTSVDEFDRPGMRIGVRDKSAYDLYLTRTLKHAELVRTDLPDGTSLDALFRKADIGALGGVRQFLDKYVASESGFRVIAVSFMDIRQAMGASRRGRSARAICAHSSKR